MRVMKFGGSCFANDASTNRVAAHIAAGGAEVAVVVSARAGATDALLAESLACATDAGRSARDVLAATGELQSAARLAMLLEGRKVATEVVAPWRVFRTNREFGDATICGIDIEPLREARARGAIPIVPGFIGATCDGRLTTLGRGGSDYSAVALGAALGAHCVDLYKADVDGVYDADPHRDARARRFRTLSHAHALRLSRAGAKVLQEKAALLAQQARLNVRVRSLFTDDPGTEIRSESDARLACCA